MSKSIIIPEKYWSNVSGLTPEQAGEFIQACIMEAQGQEVEINSQAVINAFAPLKKSIRHKREHDAVKEKFLDAVHQEELKMKIRRNNPLKVVR